VSVSFLCGLPREIPRRQNLSPVLGEIVRAAGHDVSHCAAPRAPATGLCVGTPARHGRALAAAHHGKDRLIVAQAGHQVAIFLGFDRPARGHRVEGGPEGRRTRSAPPTLDPVTTHLFWAPTRKTGAEQEGRCVTGLSNVWLEPRLSGA